MKATATRDGKTCAPALTFRHGCPIVRFRYSCNPGGDFEAQADTNTMWGPTVGDHMAVMGSPIGGCRMGPSRERDLCTREGFPFDPSR